MGNYSKPTHGEGLALIGFHIDPKRDEPEVYTLIVYGDQDTPVVVEGQMLFFCKPDLVFRAYEFVDAKVKKFASPPQDLSLVCDIAEMLDIIKNQNHDNSAVILNCLNTMFDLIQASGVAMPSEYKQILYDFADHLTFEREFLGFINRNGIERDNIINAILWCIGAIIVRAKILTD